MGLGVCIGIPVSSVCNGIGNVLLPTSLYGCILWLRSDLGITLSSGKVSRWADQSGNGNDAFNTVALNQPSYTSGSIPYLSGVAGGGNHLLSGTASLSGGAQPLELFIVGRSTQSANTGYLFEGANGNINVIYQPTGTETLNEYNNGQQIGVTLTNNADFFVDCQLNGAGSSISLNGGTPVSGTIGSSSSDTPYTILNDAGGGVEWGGRIYEVFAFNRILNTSERSPFVTYLKTRYSIS